jgi:hypothetical protein
MIPGEAPGDEFLTLLSGDGEPSWPQSTRFCTESLDLRDGIVAVEDRPTTHSEHLTHVR